MTSNSASTELVANATTSATPQRFAAPAKGDIVNCKVVKILTDKSAQIPHAALASFGSAMGMIRQRDFCGTEAEQVNRLKELKPGDEFQAMITKVDFASTPARFDLSERKAAAFAHAQSLIGHQVTGRITTVLNFGVFVDIGGDVSGLLHKDEMSGIQQKRHEGLVEGDAVNVVVVSAEPDTGNPLKLNVLLSEIDAALQKTAGLAGKIVTAQVVGPCNAGIKLALRDGVEAVLPSENLNGIAVTSLKKGNNLRIKVLGVSGRALVVTREGIDCTRTARKNKDRAKAQGAGGSNKNKK